MKKDKPQKILFVINGLGLGNSTRCYAVIQELFQQKAEVIAILCGNSIDFFKDKREILRTYTINQLEYGKSNTGGISIWKTALNIPKMIYYIWKNNHEIKRLIHLENPDAIVVDSQYIFGLNKELRSRIFAINNSKDVFERFIRNPFELSFSSALHFLFIECLDYFFHRIFYKNILSPEIPSKYGNKNLLVRRGLLPSPPQQIKNILVMLSGSTKEFDPPELLELSKNFKINVIGVPGHDHPTLFFHKRSSENEELLKNCDLLIINAGFSSLSESLALGKPTIVVPIAGHSEQKANAERFKDFGTGVVVDSFEGVPEALQSIVNQKSIFIERCRNLNFSNSQASLFARQILTKYKDQTDTDA